jgi:SAM-dependent methyltransferase
VIKARPYYAAGGLSAAFYDVVAGADSRLGDDLEAYACLASEGGSILELGAGTGRLTAGLAERGFQVVGVDVAANMLARAREKVADLPPEVAGRITLRQGDMTSLALGRTFDVVICPYFTLAHVPTGSAWRNTFAGAARHLKPGGLGAFHLPRLQVMRALPEPDPDRAVLDQPIGEGRRLRLFVLEREFRENVGRLDQVLDYVVVGAGGQILERSAERLTYYMGDPARLAAEAGLSLDRPPIDLGGIGDVWVFRRT